MDTNTSFHPVPATTKAILTDLARGDLTLLGIAQRYNTTLSDLAEWLHSAAVAERIQVIESAAARHFRLTSLVRAPKAQEALTTLLNTIDNRAISDPANHRAREQARRLVNLNLRHCRFTPPNPAAQRRPHSTSPTPAITIGFPPSEMSSHSVAPPAPGPTAINASGVTASESLLSALASAHTTGPNFPGQSQAVIQAPNRPRARTASLIAAAGSAASLTQAPCRNSPIPKHHGSPQARVDPRSHHQSAGAQTAPQPARQILAAPP